MRKKIIKKAKFNKGCKCCGEDSCGCPFIKNGTFCLYHQKYV
jgi:hypothetical protein